MRSSVAVHDDSSRGPGSAAASNLEIRKKVEGRMSGLENNRYSWWVHWRLLATYTLPRRYKWLVTPNEASRGSPLNSAIIDSTSMLAARTLTSGLLCGLTNPATPWFKFEIDGFTDVGSIGRALAGRVSAADVYSVSGVKFLQFNGGYVL